MTPDTDTIFALASGAPPAAIAVLRISGPRAGDTLMALAGGPIPAPRRLSLRRLRDAAGGELDQAMVAWMPGPGTYTGEDSVELMLHGGRAVIDGVVAELLALGLRPAEPGQFTRRAFLNGRMDLTEAEAVHDLVAAETEAQRRQALRQLHGGLHALYGGWSDRLRVVLAQQEALIDFPDEDLPPEVEAALLAELDALDQAIADHLRDGARGEKLREGLFFAITGAPNVGKSSLLNRLAGRDVAIVSPQPGTTRDALEARVVLGGVPVTIVDTAGLRETADPIEAEGVRRARARAAEADLVIAVLDASDPGADPVAAAGLASGPGPVSATGPASGPGPVSALVPASALAPVSAGGLLVVNKIDLGGAVPAGAIGVSARTGQGIEALRDGLARAARDLTDTGGEPSLTRARHRVALEDARGFLAAARQADLPELRGEDLRQALRAIGRITGQVGVEDILDTLFSAFCIGK